MNGGIRLTLMIACTVAAVSCSSTTSGVAIKHSDSPDPNGAVVGLLDTGAYATAAGHPYGVVGNDVQGQRVLEAHRIAEYTVGPWEADEALRLFPGVSDAAALIGPVPTPELMRQHAVLPDPLPDIAGAHGFVSGFSTVRISAAESGQSRGLQNVVLQFPDPAAAGAAASEMAAKAPELPGVAPGRPTPVTGTPEALAKTFDLPDGIKRIDSFTAHGPFVLYQSARAVVAFLGKTADVLVANLLTAQKKRIDEFTPTDPSAMPQMPLDPTGQLLAHTLWAPDNAAPFNAGVWQPRGWLHFEDDPVSAAALFNTAGVDVVTQRLTTVYRAANADGANRIVDEFSEQLGAMNSVKPIDGAPGLPAARCFERMQGGVPSTTAVSWQRIAWHYKCVARADRYVYTAFSDDPTDVRQQISAQYRILAGE